MIKITDDCMSCGICLDECPAGAIEIKNDTAGYAQAEINQDKCKGCKICLNVGCPADAIVEIDNAHA